jgi:hypothetical protein
MEDIKKEAQDAGDSSNMMTEYWENLKSKKDKGMTEGQAILEYLSENEAKHKRERGKK